MALTPETLPRHELVGLAVEVVESTDPGLVGVAGRVVRETTNTLLVETGDGVRQVRKAHTTFEFVVSADDDRTLDADADAGEESTTTVVVDGDVLVARPARRTETEVAGTWQ